MGAVARVLSQPTLAPYAPIDAGATGTEARVDRESASGPRVLLVSNRLPFTAVAQDDAVELRRSSGGLISALERVHDGGHGLWIGHVGATGADVDARLAEARMLSVPLSEMEVTGFYRLFANGVLWPALHGLTQPSARDRCGWGMYRAANERFADAVAARYRDGDSIWVHDYHLMLLPALLRERLPDARIGFFLHTPVPPPEELALVDHWPELVHGMLGADVIGLQTVRDARHFVFATGGEIEEQPDAVGIVRAHGRAVRVVDCPIGVDGAWFEQRARHPSVNVLRGRLRLASPGPLLVGVDRLDYTKGIPERLLAFERLLSEDAELIGRARFLQVAVPSRDGVAGYAELRRRIDALVDRINARFGTSAWQPVTCMHGAVDGDTLVALYLAADVMVVTPVRDGMNLVAKEFVATRFDGGGALVLSSGAGAAAELGDGAIVVEPGDADSIADGLRRALRLTPGESRPMMRRMRAAVGARDVYGWADRFLHELAEPHTPRGTMSDSMDAATAWVGREDLEIFGALAAMRFQLRAHELQRTSGVREALGAASELARALTRYVQQVGVVVESPRSAATELTGDTSLLCDAFARFASRIRATAEEFGSVVRGPSTELTAGEGGA